MVSARTELAEERMKKLGQKTVSSFSIRLNRELNRLQRRTNIGYEIEVKWQPGTVKHHNGKQLVEEVVGDMILI